MSKRYANFDYLRGLAILAVVIIHVTAPSAVDGLTGTVILNQMMRFGVPVFIFLSGWGLTVSKSYQRANRYFDFLKKRLMKLLPAYLLWNVVYLLLRVFIHEDRFSLGEIIEGVLRGTLYPHLYFVPLIVLFYLVYPLLLRLGRKEWGVLLAAIVTTLSLVATWGVYFEGFTRNHNPLNWLFYFVFGIWIAENSEQLKTQLNKTIISMLLILTLANVLFEPLELTEELVLTQTRLSVLLYSVMVVLLVIMVLPEAKNLLTAGLNALSDYSYQIYLSHYFFIRLYREWLPGMHPFLQLLLVLLSSYILAKITHKLLDALFNER